jgi:spore photoproduct lyase
MLTQPNLFETSADYEPRLPASFTPDTIILTRGANPALPLIDRIRRLYPAADVVDQTSLSHAKVKIPGRTLMDQHHAGKKTLLFGELKSAVRFSDESNNTCPNYWHFSPYGFCPYGCYYCYLAGTPGVQFCPAVKIYLNLSDMLTTIDAAARKIARPTAFYLGKLQDGLALDPLTGYSRIMIPFFAKHPYARLIVLTKSADVKNLLDLDHADHTILSWSLNPPAVAEQFETNTPAVENRLRAMEQCAAAGYPVRAIVMPIIPVPNWPDLYRNFLSNLLQRIPLQRLTLGGICSYSTALTLMNEKMSHQNTINKNLAAKSPDGRRRYPPEKRREMYAFLLQCIRTLRPELPVALCLEEPPLWQALNLQKNQGQCNCLL